MSDPFIPADPQDADLGILEGIIRNRPTTRLGQSVYEMAGFRAEEQGPTRRPGTIKFAGGAVVSYVPGRDIFQLFNSAGTQRIGVLDKYFLYLASASALIANKYGTSAGTMRTSGAKVVGNASTNWTAALLRGNDWILLKPGASQQYIQIDSVQTKSVLTLKSVPSPAPYASGSAYKAHKAFDYAKSRFVDWTTCDSKIVLSDGVRPPAAWNGAALSLYSASLTFAPLCVCYFQDRLWLGNVKEGSVYHRHRIRWSKTTNHTSFVASPDTQWLDRPYSPGELLRLLPFGKLLAAYYSDRVEVGRPTNIAGDILPVSFETVDTGGAGLVGMKAVIPFYDGHFLVLDDNIYFFSNQGFEPIGNPVFKDMISGAKTLQGMYAAIDWANDCVVFGFPDDSGTIARQWCYNYRSKRWSYDEIPTTMLGGVLQTTSPTIDGLSGTINSQTWAIDDQATSYKKQMVYSAGGAFFLLSTPASDDHDGGLISARIVTGDYEFGAANTVKTMFSLSLKVDRLMSATTTFGIEGSTNRGLSWKALGSIVIPVGEDEGECAFKLTGSMLRLRISSSSKVPKYSISELVARVRGRGRELRFGPAD